MSRFSVLSTVSVKSIIWIVRGLGQPNQIWEPRTNFIKTNHDFHHELRLRRPSCLTIWYHACSFRPWNLESTQHKSNAKSDAQKKSLSRSRLCRYKILYTCFQTWDISFVQFIEQGALGHFEALKRIHATIVWEGYICFVFLSFCSALSFVLSSFCPFNTIKFFLWQEVFGLVIVKGK